MKANKPPKFHHYIPKTYLKHWLDDKKLIYIYNKKNHTIKQSSINGQYFGKNHLNTITYPDDTKGYWVESALAELEGKITPVLDKIANSSLAQSESITYDDKLMLSMFVSAQFWRLPVNAGLIEEQLKSGDFTSIGLSITNPDSGTKPTEDEAMRLYETISNTDLFKKAYPMLMSLSYTMNNSKYENLRNWAFYFQQPGFNLTSDNPIFYFNQPDSDSIFSNFILPISPGVLLIANDKQPDEISSTMSNALNIFQMCNANQFVASDNKEYLQTIADMYKDSFAGKSVQEVQKYIYSEIFK